MIQKLVLEYPGISYLSTLRKGIILMTVSNIQILLLRLTLGGLFLHLGIGKMSTGWLLAADNLLNSLNNLHQTASGLQLTYIDSVAIPHAPLWSTLIALGETAVGVSLLLGLLVRFSSLVGIFMLLNFHSVTGSLYSLNFFGSSSAALIIVSFLVLFLARGGRYVGLDVMLAKVKPRSLLW